LQALEYLSQTPLVLWVAESDFGYPTVLTLHSIGMALVVGIIMMFDLRVIGIGAAIPLRAFDVFFPVAWTGLLINVISGALLFCANYSAFLHNTAFITKLVLLFTAAIAAWQLTRRIDRGALEWQTTASRGLAALSLALLLGAITAGRIIGYTSVPE
jgi:hypothetical protein